MRPLNNWKKFEKDELPLSVYDAIRNNNGFHNSYVSWFHDVSFRKGDLFIVVTDDGGYYKVGAQFMVWHNTPDGRVLSQAIWSMAALRRTLKSLMLTGETTPDPGYQT